MTMSAITPVKKEDGLKALIQSPQFKDQVAKALPKHITADRMLRVMLTAVNKNPKLLGCSKESLLGALMTCSQLGLEPDGRNAHLIPYGNTCQLIIDYKGKVELLMRTGLVASIHADVVCTNDEFQYDRGEIKKHSIDFKKSRGDVYAVYAICRLKDGTEKSEVMSRDEVEEIRKISKSSTGPAWKDHWNEMAKKTVFNRMSKWLPISPEIRDQIEKEYETEFEKPTSVPVTVSPSFDLPEVEDQKEENKTLEPTQEGSGEIPPSEMSIEVIRLRLKQEKIAEKVLVDFLVDKGDLPKGDPQLESLTDEKALLVAKSIDSIIEKLK